MVRKIIGTVLIVLASVMGLLLIIQVNNGGSLMPHAIGPIAFALVGIILLSDKGKVL